MCSLVGNARLIVVFERFLAHSTHVQLSGRSDRNGEKYFYLSGRIIERLHDCIFLMILHSLLAILAINTFPCFLLNDELRNMEFPVCATEFVT